MTKQEHFKQRIRARMTKTGERYGAARRALIDRSSGDGGGDGTRRWVGQPEVNDESVTEHTGRGWDEWCDLIEEWPGHVDGHAAVAAHVHDTYDVTHWWAQGITVGWERITGQRVVNQRSDGTFGTSKTRTVTVDHDELRAALFDDDERAELFPGLETVMRSRATTKVPKVAFPDGFALFTLTPLDGRVRINVSHEALDSPEAVEEWKTYWSEWLVAVDESQP